MTKKVEYPVDKAALEEMSRGMIYAELAITDNKEGTLAKIGKANPSQTKKEKRKDAVVRVPPKILGFDHLVDPTVIKDDGNIFLISKEDDIKDNVSEIFGRNQEDNLMRNIAEGAVDDSPEDTEDVSDEDAKYNRILMKIPKAFRDHMPDIYLKPILRAQGVIFVKKDNTDNNVSDESSTQKIEQDKTKKTKKSRPKWVPKLFRKKTIDKIEPTE
ncbi:hypothetical protein FRACYDRAFT_242326 [Fragilariopsis cylindrus CCMP1102]|uniref:Uncharacterized protein n=1 Tax=Fragilariopsis cylindrus CCMP1102 TaxID=635003 RepID=A0A1E7F7Y6_9STRA|nr:hypothetical protein FRACYDRAFT_242326 [Fragilariopsis cylindrus CCMP1102]|eukprot:OEU13973.1 hypothetical protein FRACYDRAFT_242326 [Fragilariopsis cylindrus CCMP1102]